MLTGSVHCTEMGKAQTASMHCKQQEVDFNSRTLCWNMMRSLTPISGTIVLAASLFKVQSALLTSQQHHRVTLVCWRRKDGGVKSSDPGTKCYRTFISSSLLATSSFGNARRQERTGCPACVRKWALLFLGEQWSPKKDQQRLLW